MILGALPHRCIISTDECTNSVITVLVLGVGSGDPEDPYLVRYFGLSVQPTTTAPEPTAEPSSNLLTFSSTTGTWDSAT